MTCKLTPHAFPFFPFFPPSQTQILKPDLMHSFPQIKYTLTAAPTYHKLQNTFGNREELPYLSSPPPPPRIGMMMTPRSSCNHDDNQSTERDDQKQIPYEESEVKKTDQQSSSDEETQSILKLSSTDTNEKDLEIHRLQQVVESDMTAGSAAEATLLPMQELTPLVEDNIRTGSPVNMEGQTTSHNRVLQAAAGGVEDSGRERLKRHRVEMAGRVWIPDMWGQEGLLKDWIDCSTFDASLMNSNVMLARAALAQEGRRAASTRIRIENSC